MSATRTLDVAVASDLLPLLDEAVASGEYGTASDVVNDALRVWRKAREANQLSPESLRLLWREGLDSGPAVSAEAEFQRLLDKFSDADSAA
jgi:antitoxin ParD1/3/4